MRSCDPPLLQVSTLFEEEASIFPLKGDSVDLSCPIDPTTTQEEMAQSAHLMTLGLCRISVSKPPPTPPPPSASRPTVNDASGLSAPGGLKKSQHARSSPSRKRRLPCLLCPLTLSSRRLLDVHVRSHQGAGGFSCVRCSWKADSWEELEPHWRSHCRRRSRPEEQKQEKKRRKKETGVQSPDRFSGTTSRNQQTHDSCGQRRHRNHTGQTVSTCK